MTDPTLPILKEVAQIPGLLKDIYGDLAEPGVEQVGKALGTVFGLGNTIPWPITLLNEKSKIALEKNLEKYRLQLHNIPEKDIVAVPPEVGVPISERLTYVTNEELSDLYINLLTKASTINTAHLAHPSFVNLINNLSPDEAILLAAIHSNLAFVTVRLVNKIGEKALGDWMVVEDLLTGLEDKVNLSFPKNIVAYFSNFVGLGIIEIQRGIVSAHPDLYDQLEQIYRPIYENFSLVIQKKCEIQFKKGKIDVTPFGQLFIDACLSKTKQGIA